ncbi:MAG: Holliday junction branch migration protein RuvA [Rhodospirillales bacterium]|nr:Holliday junction branch migration protein RuvA [Rhodospirillales bacterium]
MIAKLKGLVESASAEGAVIDVGGVGYAVQGSARLLGRLPGPGQPVALVIETQWRDDGPHLYAFLEVAERDWFRLLIGVQGVGAKTALAVLSILGPDELAQAIAAQDKAAVGRASGVGPKLAARIVSELKDKVGGIALGAAVRSGPAAVAVPAGGGASTDALSALVNLGYGRSEAFAAVSRAALDQGPGAKVDALVRAALKDLSQ